MDLSKRDVVMTFLSDCTASLAPYKMCYEPFTPGVYPCLLPTPKLLFFRAEGQIIKKRVLHEMFINFASPSV